MNDVIDTGAEILISADMGCLMNIGVNSIVMGKRLRLCIAEVLNHEVDETHGPTANHIGRVRGRTVGLSTSNKPLSERIEESKKMCLCKRLSPKHKMPNGRNEKVRGSFRQLATMA